jgi:general nucleoside transport system ATP-binding protein
MWIDRKAAVERTEEVIRAFDVRTPGRRAASRAVGRQPAEAGGRPGDAHRSTMLVAAHPTRGIDVGAQAAVWEQLKEARQAGLAVLLISADLEELLGLSDTACSSSARAACRPARSIDGHAEGAGLVHDRRPRGGGGA